MTISFLRIARAELDDAFAWYEQQAVGLGYDFLDELDKTLRLITSFPHLHPLINNQVRRCLLNRFPYAIYYGLAENRIIVIAVAHLKRQPDVWIGRSEV
jgi:plasmid stabilization system protein ParE